MTVSFRDLATDDKERIRNWRNLPHVRSYLLTDHEILENEHDAWFAGIQDDETTRYWIISLRSEPIGLAYLYDINSVHRRCFWGYYIAEEGHRGQGIGSRTWYFLMEQAFEHHGVEKLLAEVLAFNARVVYMHRRFGFTEEGLLREHVRRTKKRDDVMIFGMLRREWEALRAELEASLRDRGVLD